MLRTTLYLPETLHQRLHIVSKRKNKSVSKLAIELLDQGLAEEENRKLDEAYKALRSIKGIVKDNVPNAASSIDETLYGEQGAWRGKKGEIGLWTKPNNPPQA